MFADALEIHPRLELDSSNEVYAHSLSTHRKVGATAVNALVDIEYKEAVENLGYDDFETAVAEMLKTDEEFGIDLEVENESTHPIIDDKVRAGDGEAMVDKLERGARKSAQLAEKDEGYKHQAERDGCDVELIKWVDGKLGKGQAAWAVSFAPQKALSDHPEIYDKKFGYDEYLVYIQGYAKSPNDILTALSYSIHVENKEEFIKVLAEFGMKIPEGESDNTWLNHAQTMIACTSTTKEFLTKVRDTYYERAGHATKKQSISEYIEANKEKLRAIYDTYYPALGKAIYTGKNNQIIQSFANAVQNSEAKLKPEIRRQLIKLSNAQSFTDEDGILLDSVIRYAAAEEMRKGLKHKPKSQTYEKVVTKDYVTKSSLNLNGLEDINALLSKNINEGIKAGRSYGGCPGNIELGENDPLAALSKGLDIENKIKVQQAAFGGIENKMNWKWKEGVCIVKGCKTRPGKTKVGPCNICEPCTIRDNNGEKLEIADEEVEESNDEEQKNDNVIKLFEWKKKDDQPEPTSQPITA